MKHASAAKADVHGAIFFYLREMLMEFCTRLHTTKISFRLFCLDALDIGQYLTDLNFDRIEVCIPYLSRDPQTDWTQISNVCDGGYLGPEACLRIFSPLLKPRSVNPRAALVMLFINAVNETMQSSRNCEQTAVWHAQLKAGIRIVNDYISLPRKTPDAIRLHTYRMIGCMEMFKDWEYWFKIFVKASNLVAIAKTHGLKIRNTHAIVQPWPCKADSQTTKEEFEILRASGLIGRERYVEFQKQQ